MAGVRGASREQSDADFRTFMAARAPGLRRTAYVMCGDWHHAEDLVQIAFAKLYGAWSRIKDSDGLDGYLRTTLTHAVIDENRRGFRRRERPSAHLPDIEVPVQTTSDVRQVLLQALAAVPPRQRTCLVLRYFDDVSVAEVARILGCHEGTVKSQTARGLTNLRRILRELDPEFSDALADFPALATP